MSSEKETAACPSCGIVVSAPKGALAKPARCPQCKQVVQFEITRSEEDAIADAAKTAARGAKKAAGLAGGVMKKAAAFGLSKYKEHRKAAEAAKAVTERLRTHLTSELPSGEALESITNECATLGIDVRKSAGPLMVEIDGFFKRALAAIQTGGPAAGNRPLLARYIDTFVSDADAAAGLRTRIARAFTLRAIADGTIKPASNVTGLVVRSSEIVWHQCPAKLVQRSKAGEEQGHDGQLYVTNVRIVFTSRTVPGETPLSAINAVTTQSNRVLLTGKTASSSSEYLVSDAELMSAFIQHAIRIFHRHVDVGYEKGDDRRIPQEVKDVVWQRDGGRCVECGADDYLEFDHVIPHSKGGANTVENIQLLCRRCNQKKSNRI